MTVALSRDQPGVGKLVHRIDALIPRRAGSRVHAAPVSASAQAWTADGDGACLPTTTIHDASRKPSKPTPRRGAAIDVAWQRTDGLDAVHELADGRLVATGRDCLGFACAGEDDEDRSSIADVLLGMKMPCLLFAGEADPRFAKVQQCAAQLNNATFFSLPGRDHVGGMLASALVVPHITSFLAGSAN